MIQQLTLTQHHWQEIQDHVSAHAPLEACGLLAGKNNQVEKVIVVQNQAQSVARFVMDPYEQLKAFDWIESNGLELVAIFHSHPTGPETASVTDIAEAAYAVVHVIVSQSSVNWKARGFWIEGGKAIDVTLKIVE